MAAIVNGEDVMEKGEVGDAKAENKKDTVGRRSLRSSNATALGTSSEPVESGGIRLIQRLRRLRNVRFRRNKSTRATRATIVRTLEQCPDGYPRLAAFLDSGEDFMLYRRFGFMQARVLLYKQDELRALEERLDGLDKEHELTDVGVLKSRELDDLKGDRRKTLMRDIESKFEEYAKLLVVARDLAGLNRPTGRDFRSVKNYFDARAPLCNREAYIYHREDLVTLSSRREHAWLDAFVEKVLLKLTSRFTRYIFSNQDLRAKANAPTDYLTLYDRERIDILVSIVNMCIIVALMVIPVYLLWSLTTADEAVSSRSTSLILAVLSICTMIFSLVLSYFTRAKRHEILASAAAYCAVMVVFIGNMKQMGPNTFSGPASNSTTLLQPNQ